jgi:hypothetical protein
MKRGMPASPTAPALAATSVIVRRRAVTRIVAEGWGSVRIVLMGGAGLLPSTIVLDRGRKPSVPTVGRERPATMMAE